MQLSFNAAAIIALPKRARFYGLKFLKGLLAIQRETCLRVLTVKLHSKE